MQEIIQDGENGYLTRTWTPTELSVAVLKLLDDDDLYRRASASAIRAVAPFEASTAIEKYAKAYLQIVAS